MTGEPEGADARRIALVHHAETAAARRRTVGHAEVERLVESLAARMVDELGRHDIAELRFVAVPRGGLIVLGQLAYALGLDRHQLDAAAGQEGPLCLVDDCALSGRRIGEVLDRVDGDEPILFAHLLSHPAVRARIEASDERVRCLAAEDLVDHREPVSSADDRWEQRWSERDTPGARWRGQTDVIAFPWAEPDVAQWDDVGRAVERGWRIASPDRCLKTRFELGPPRDRSWLLRWRVPDDVLHGTFDGEVLLYRLGSGTLHRPSREGAVIWSAVARYGDEAAAVEALVADHDVDACVAEADVARFVEVLRCAGLLEEAAR